MCYIAMHMFLRIAIYKNGIGSLSIIVCLQGTRKLLIMYLLEFNISNNQSHNTTGHGEI